METNPYAAADAAERQRVIARRAQTDRDQRYALAITGRYMTGEELGEWIADNA